MLPGKSRGWFLPQTIPGSGLGQQSPGTAQLCLLEVGPAQGSERNCEPCGAVLLHFPCGEEQQPQYLELVVQDELRDTGEDLVGAQVGPVPPLHFPDEGNEV